MKFQIMATFGTTAEDTASCFWLATTSKTPPRDHKCTEIQWQEDKPERATTYLELETAQRWMRYLVKHTEAGTLTLKITRDATREQRERLEYLRGELRAERISYGELHELQTLAPYIDAGDVELLEAAGVPEGN